MARIHLQAPWLFFAVFIMLARISEQVSVRASKCGVTYGCIKWPPGCDLLKCKILIRFLKTSNAKQISMEITGFVDGWIAFGFSDRPRVMGGVHGEVCMKEKSLFALKSFENEETDFHLKPLNGNITGINTVYYNGRLSCTYTRAMKSNTLLDVSKPYYVVVSWGKTRMKGSNIHAREHNTGDYFWSKSKVMLSEIADVRLTTFGWNLIALHGSFMTIAWIGFGFSGIFYARYMKGALGQKKLCGTAFWFQFHRVSFFICTGLVIVALIIILAEAGGWNSEMDAHPLLGIMTVILLCLQAVAGIIRPAVDSPKRIMFKYGHRITGAVTYILAVITIFLGLAAVEVDLAVFIIYLVVILVIFFGMEVLNFYKSRTVAEVPYNDAELDSTASDSTSTEDSTPYSLKGIFPLKAMSMFVVGFGILMALVVVSLIGHKGYVYHKKSIAG